MKFLGLILLFFSTGALCQVRFIQIADPHVYSKYTSDALKSVINEINHYDVDFVVSTGDNVNNGDSQFEVTHFKATIETLKAPFHSAMGNHDLVTYTKHPKFYSFNLKGVHFVLLNVFDDSKEQLKWFKNDLNKNSLPTVVFCHEPLTGDLKSVASTYKVKYLFSGHLHTNRVFKDSAGLNINTPPVRMGGLDGSLMGFRVVTISNNGEIKFRLTPAGLRKRSSLINYKVGGTMNLVARFIDSTIEATTATITIQGRSYNFKKEGRWSFSLSLPERLNNSNSTVRFYNDGKLLLKSRVKLEVASPAEFITLKNSWPTFQRNRRRTGSSNIVVSKMKINSAKKIGEIAFKSGPIIYDHHIYVETSSWSENNQHKLIKYNPYTAEPIWNFTFAGEGISVPDIENGTISIKDVFNNNYSIRTGGKELESDWGEIFSFVDSFFDGVRYSGSLWQDGLSAYRVRSGALLWRRDFKNSFGSRPVISEKLNRLFYISNDSLHALNLNEGTTLWSIPNFEKIIATPALDIDEKYLYAVNKDGTLLKVDTKSGSTIWKSEFTKPFSSSAHPYYFKGRQSLSSPVVTKNRVIAIDINGIVNVINKSNGKVVQRVDLGAPTASSPALSGNSLFVTTMDGYLFCLTWP